MAEELRGAHADSKNEGRTRKNNNPEKKVVKDGSGHNKGGIELGSSWWNRKTK